MDVLGFLVDSVDVYVFLGGLVDSLDVCGCLAYVKCLGIPGNL